MKNLFLILLLTISTFAVAQDNHIVKTEDGRRVLLKADFTWEYIDLEVPPKATPAKPNKPVATLKKATKSCNTRQNFTEPKLNSKIQAQLKRGRATITHIKKKVAKDYNCSVDQVLLLSASETKKNGMYDFCANGTKVTYKRVGSSIIQKGKFL